MPTFASESQIGLSDILSSLQNGVTAINNLTTTLSNAFPSTAAAPFPPFSAANYGIYVVTDAAFGADPTGATDSSSAFQAADAAAANGAGSIYVPPGFYKLLSGVSLSDYVIMHGGPAVLYSDNTNVTVVTLNGYRSAASNLLIQGGGIGATQPTVRFSSLAIEAAVINCPDIRYGAQCIKFDSGSADCILYNIFTAFAYGNSVILVQNGNGGGATYMYRIKADQGFPSAFPGVGTTPSSWTSSAVTALDTVVTISSLYYIQCVSSGTTGAAQPSPQNYDVDIVDGSVTWRLVAPTNYASLKIDHSFATFAEDCDHTGAFDVGIELTDDNALGGPQGVNISRATVGQCWSFGIGVAAGAGINIQGGQIANIIGGTGYSAAIVLSGGGDVTIGGGLLVNGGVVDGLALISTSVKNVSMTNTQIYGCTGAAVDIGPGQEQWTIGHCMLGGSNTWGANASPWFISSNCDFASVIGNIITGATSGGTNNSTAAANLTVFGNN